MKKLDECKIECRKYPHCTGFDRVSKIFDWENNRGVKDVDDNHNSWCDLITNVQDNNLGNSEYYDIYEKKWYM
jgi:hypothetical protein